MKALILAGGLGTRLRPLTYTRPKHLLPVANKPHLEHVFDLLTRHGVVEAVLLTSYLRDAFGPSIEQASERGLAVDVTVEETPLGTAGAIKNAEDVVGDGPFFVFNGDVLTDVDLTAVREFHEDRGAAATIVLTPVEDPSRFGVVTTTDEGLVERFVEKPPAGEAPTNLINAGIYVFTPPVLDRIPRGEVWSAEHALFPELVEEDAGLYACDTDAYWADIGTPQSYVAANVDALEGRYRFEGEDEIRGGVLVDRTAHVSGSAQLSSTSVGAGAVIEDGAVLDRSVLLPGAVVSSSAKVVRSIIGARARVGSGAVVTDRAIADDDVVEEG